MRLKIGSILQINTNKGIGLCPIHPNHPDFGTLVRVIEGFHTTPPTDLVALVN